MSQADVTVIVSVYNTMPYLTDCLTSLVEQTIGVDRIEIVAVDDGSTDGSGDEIDRFAELYPGTISSLHQPNSGGPASPCNKGLEVATGRYVFFIGADDHLGAEALERLVKAADEWESDVVLGKLEGTSGRKVYDEIFTEQSPDVDLFESRLPYALANVKLFRRALIEKYRLRFPEDLPMGSDQPFTFEALLRSNRTSILNDYTYYYAVRRADASNITFSSTDLLRAQCAGRVMDFVAGLVEPGSRRDWVLRRHFQWELSETLQSGFPDATADEQSALCAEVGGLVEKYFTDNIRDSLAVSYGLRFELARAGELETLRDVIRVDYGSGAHPPPFITEGGRVFRGYPGLGQGRIGDDAYEVRHRRLVGPVGKQLKIDATREADGGLDIDADLPVVPRTGGVFAEFVLEPIRTGESVPKARIRAVAEDAGKVLARIELSADPESGSNRIHAHISPGALAPEGSNDNVLSSLRLQFPVGDTVLDFPVRIPASMANAGAGLWARVRQFGRRKH